MAQTDTPGRGERLTARGKYWARIAGLVLRHPIEALDRLRGRIERWREPPSIRTIRPEESWQRLLHQRLGRSWPCSEIATFWELWGAMGRELGSLGFGHDLDSAPAAGLWCIARHLGTKSIVETGVARGVTSRVLLEAMGPDGMLWSVDLPPLLPGWVDQVGVAVPDRLRSRWRYIRGSSRRCLPRVLANAGTIDLFVHDSLHTSATMAFELGVAWGYLRPGGVVVADDIDMNSVFAEFAARSDSAWSLVARDLSKAHCFGVVWKAGS
jgi:predicted O-methyltransferase YrrM